MADWEQLRDLTHRVAPPDFASLARTARHRQRRARAAVGVLAALVLVGGGLGVAALDDTDQAPFEPAEDPSESIIEDPETVLTLPDRAPGESAVDLPGGRYRVPLNDTLSFEVDVPDHTTAHDDGLFLATKDFIVKTEVAGPTYGVPLDPCARQSIVPAGPTLEDLVQAIGNLPIYRLTRPEPVELGGAQGTYIEARIPRRYDASPCTGNAIELPGKPHTAVSGPPPYVGRWWVLDVDGQRVVVQQNCWGCSPDQLDRHPAILQGLTFTTG